MERPHRLHLCKNQVIQGKNLALKTCGFIYTAVDSVALEKAFQELKSRIGDLIPQGFIFELVPDIYMGRSVALWGAKFPEAQKLPALNRAEKAFVAAVNARFVGQTHYQTVSDMIAGEMAETLGVKIECRMYGQLSAVPLGQKDRILAQFDPSEKGRSR